MMIYLKLQHLNPHLLFGNLNFIILFQAQKETLAHSVKAVNQFVQFLVGTAGFQINLCSIGRIQNIDFMTQIGNRTGKYSGQENCQDKSKQCAEQENSQVTDDSVMKSMSDFFVASEQYATGQYY